VNCTFCGFPIKSQGIIFVRFLQRAPAQGQSPGKNHQFSIKRFPAAPSKYTVFQIFKNFYYFRLSIFPPAGKPAFSSGFRSEIHSTLRQAAPFFALQESARRSDSGLHERQGGVNKAVKGIPAGWN
jgi:hypothetical protein